MNQSTDRTPAEEMRAAAKLLRETGTVTTPGPWTTGHVPGVGWCVSNPTLSMCVAAEQGWLGEGDAAWIALAHPGLAEPLAQWLENTSLTLGRPGHREWHGTEKAALAAARIINGGESR